MAGGQPGQISAAVYDSRGRMVRELARALPAGADRQTLRWDGLDMQGRPVPPGDYEWRSLETQGLRSEYLMSVGTSVGDRWWPGNHGGPDAVVVAEDSLVAAAHLLKARRCLRGSASPAAWSGNEDNSSRPAIPSTSRPRRRRSWKCIPAVSSPTPVTTPCPTRWLAGSCLRRRPTPERRRFSCRRSTGCRGPSHRSRRATAPVWAEAIRLAGGDPADVPSRIRYAHYASADENGDRLIDATELRLGPAHRDASSGTQPNGGFCLRIDDGLSAWIGSGSTDVAGIYRIFKPEPFSGCSPISPSWPTAGC